MMVFESRSTAETEALAARIAARACPGQVYCLQGELGVGKTAFARGFARGLGISGEITSPTFTLVHEYRLSGPGIRRFAHFDVYRLENEEELWDIGWDDYLRPGCVCLVEWADSLREAMPPEACWILIEKDLTKGTDYRRITLSQEPEGTDLSGFSEETN